MICYVSQGYGASRLTGPWRHKPRPPWRLSANPDAWHGPNRPMGAIQELWMAMICFHRGQFQSCGISMDEKNVSRRGWTEQERIRLLPSHITSSHSRNNKAFFFFNEMYLKRVIHRNHIKTFYSFVERSGLCKSSCKSKKLFHCLS